MTKYENQALHDEVFVMEECFFFNCVLKECDIFYFGGDVEWTNLQFPELPLALPRSRPEDHTVGEKPWDDERNSDSTTMPGEYVEDELALASTTDAAQNSKVNQAPNCPDSELSGTMFESAQSNICPQEATESFYSGEVRKIPARGCPIRRN
jgi:hypothetical protein